jgi:hypothetical protein
VFLSGADGMWYVGQGIHADGQRHADPRPIVHDEPIGLAFGNGATFHSDAGTRSERLGPVKHVCAEAFFGEFRDR